jgi:hypothetical protein
VEKALKAFWKQWRISKWRHLLWRWRPWDNFFTIKLHICSYLIYANGRLELIARSSGRLELIARYSGRLELIAHYSGRLVSNRPCWNKRNPGNYAITSIIFHKKPTKTYTLSNSLLKKMFYSSHRQHEKLFKNELFSRIKSYFWKLSQRSWDFSIQLEIIPSFCTMVAKISLQCICSWFCQFQHSQITA